MGDAGVALPPLPRPRTLSIMPTFQCTAACRHCGTLSHPGVHTSLDRDVILEAIRQAAAAGFGLVVFTGGEPTLAGDDLLDGLAETRRLGLISRVVTNCHWATDQRAADEFVATLKTHGLNEINFSTGDQHARYVPIEHVLRAIQAAVENHFMPAVMVETVSDRVITKQTIEEHPHFVEIRRRFPDRLVKINESPWMPLKPKKITEYPAGMAIDAGNLQTCGGCDSVQETITLQADGRLGACCGLGMRLVPELQVGKAGETTLAEAVERSEEDFLKRWIRIEGPERILAWAATFDTAIEWEGMYAHRCQACLRLYKDDAVRAVIREHWREKVPDVLFGDWLLHEYEGVAG
jgi:organic radical activating enzyme